MFANLTGRQLTQRTRAAGLAFGTYTALMLVFENRMKRSGGPGIIALELAGDGLNAQTILDSWGPSGVAAARTSLRLDFGYMGTYGVLAALLSAGARRRFSSRESALHNAVPAACAIAVAADAVEGVALLRVVDGRRVDDNARVANIAARTKFGALGGVSAYWLVSRWSRVRG